MTDHETPGESAQPAHAGETAAVETPAKREPRVRSFQPSLWAKLLPLAIVAVYTVLFIALNTKQTKISFVFVSTRVSLIFLILLALGIGIVLGVLVSQLHRHRQRRR